MGLPSKSSAPPPPVELDLGRYELRRAGRRVKLARKAMELLIFFVHRREQLVSRPDIVKRLWPSDLFIDTDRNINNLVRKIRTALADRAPRPRFLETVVGKGYRFIGPVRLISPLYSAAETSDAPTPPRAAPARWPEERASLAVLPLRFLGSLDDDSGLGPGFADALVSRLAGLQGIDVLPVAATFHLPSSASPGELAPRLGVRFLLHGAVQSSKGQARLSAELFDAQSGAACFRSQFVLQPSRPFAHVDAIAARVARSLQRPLRPSSSSAPARYSRDRLAYAEFIAGYRLSSSGDAQLLEQAAQHLTKAVARDPSFALAHATLSFVCSARHFEFLPVRDWLDRAEFHAQRALDLDPALAEAHVARAFLLWAPSRNFQHLEALAELKRALALQPNLPHAYNRLGTILAHIGLLDHARSMYERGRAFDPRRSLSHSISQVYVWSGDYDLARAELRRWRADNPNAKYALHFSLQLAILTADWDGARDLLRSAASLMPGEPLIASLEGMMHAARGNSASAMQCFQRACADPKSFGHAHHTYYQLACLLSLLDRMDPAFDWLERSVDTGFACWPFFLKDPCLQNLRRHPRFELLISSLQARYPDHLGLL